MSTENKKYVIKYLKDKFKNKEDYYKKLYINAVKQYKFLTYSADVRQILPNPNPKERDYQLRLTNYCHKLLSSFEKEGINTSIITGKYKTN